jgi:hypothetical protein
LRNVVLARERLSVEADFPETSEAQNIFAGGAIFPTSQRLIY